MDAAEPVDPVVRARWMLRWLGAADVALAIWYAATATAVLLQERLAPISEPWIVGMFGLWLLGAAVLGVAGVGLYRSARGRGRVGLWLALAIAASLVGATPIGVGTFAFGLPHFGRGLWQRALVLTLTSPPLSAAVHGVVWLLHAAAIRRMAAGGS